MNLTPSSDPAPGSTVLKVRGPEDFVAFTPMAMGFVPESSVVMLTFGGAAGSFHARCTLPEDPDDLDQLLAALLRPAGRHGVESVALLLYAEDSPLVDQAAWVLRDGFVDAGITLLEMLRVHEERWFAVLPGHPPEHYAGVPFDLRSHPFTAQGVIDGRVTLGSREELRATLDPDPVATGQTAAALAGASPLVPEALQELVCGRLADTSVLTVAELAGVVTTLHDRDCRVSAWAWMTRDVARAAVTLWSDAVRRTPPSHVGPVAAVLAFCAWLAGDGALAWCAVDRSRVSDRDDSLASLVADLLDAATSPAAWDTVRGEGPGLVGPAA